MIYDVTLRIGYDYPEAVADARHILRMRPRGDFGQSIEGQTLAVAPEPGEAASDRDFFGNRTDHLLFARPHDSLSVAMMARVRVHRAAPRLENTPLVPALAARAAALRETDALSPSHFLGDSRLVAVLAARDYARRVVAPSDLSASGLAALGLARRIRSEFAYIPGSTTVGTGIDEAIHHRRGVCQDFAHVMIACLRSLEIPAAYASGFLRTDPPPGGVRLAGTDAMHAWVMAWLGDEAGWTGFDPTNGVVVSEDHIVVALGRDYADVAPIDGVLVTSGPQMARHSVDVVPVEPAAS